MLPGECVNKDCVTEQEPSRNHCRGGLAVSAMAKCDKLQHKFSVFAHFVPDMVLSLLVFSPFQAILVRKEEYEQLLSNYRCS